MPSQLAHVAWHRDIHQGLFAEHMFHITSACRHAAEPMESTQVLSQLPAVVVNVLVVILLVAGGVVTVVIVE